MSHIFNIANALFEDDLKIVMTCCRLPPRTHDDIVEIRATVFALFGRRKYLAFTKDFPVAFVITPTGEIVFDSITKTTIVERYGRALLAVTPDTEYLMRTIAEDRHVEFRASDFKL